MKEKDMKVLYPDRHIILCAKGHYYTNGQTWMMMDVLRKCIVADRGGFSYKKTVTQQTLEILSEIAAEALKSGNTKDELASHINFLSSRYKHDSEEKEVGLADFDTLLCESLLAIIARWNLSADIDLGEADPRVAQVTSPKIPKG